MKQTILAAAIVVTAACGGDDPVHEGTINASGARSSVESVHDVFAAMDAANGEGAASAVIALTAAGQIVVTPGAAAPAHVPELAYLPAQWPRSKTSASFTGSAECTATGCTFVDFGDDSEYGSYRINGSIQRRGDTLAFDLTYDITTSGLDFHWELDGNVRVNATLIDGEVESRGEANVSSEGRSYRIGWEFDIDYDMIGLDGGGCPVSGSLSATVGYSVSGDGGSGSYRAAGSVRFGPTCGQVQAN
jgi:hypothetical protein